MAKSRMRFETALRVGERKARELGGGKLPIDPVAIAEGRGIVVSPKPTSEPGVSGFLMKSGDAFGIMYATDIDNDGRKRFTVAHELGHYFLDGHPAHLFATGDGVHASRSGFITRDPYELEADYFATGLLMPSHLFVPAMEDAGEGFAAVESLASLCRTSLTATAIRYAECSEYPVAAVVSDRERVAFCAMSDCIRSHKEIEWLTKGSVVAQGTATFKFNQDSASIARGARAQAWTTLDQWFDGAPELQMKEDVVGLGGYGKTLTVLFTDEPLEDDDELEEDEE
ncbi:MAG: hypothetical protein AMXMBFR58_15920 [Phycisphaerae bacterium]